MRGFKAKYLASPWVPGLPGDCIMYTAEAIYFLFIGVHLAQLFQFFKTTLNGFEIFPGDAF